MNRIQIIQSLINKIGAKKYLEVGVQSGVCFRSIECETKIGVDPDQNSYATHHMTSDDFFEKLEQLEDVPKLFDVCFSDGLHHADQSERDLLNMIEHLSEDGYIVVHDNLPTSEKMQLIPLTDQYEWTGNVWETWVKFRMTRRDLEMFVVDTDHGCGIIYRGSQDLLQINSPINYEGFVKNRDEWMNVISVEEFQKRFL